MAIILNDNIKINAGKPSESKYLSSGNTAFTSVSEVYTQIPISERYLGLTVLLDSGGSNVEYWWKEGVLDTNLIEKKFASEQLVGDFITGATNLGYFSGYTKIQNLDLSGSGFLIGDRGLYYSEYNYYYADSSGIIRIGSSSNDNQFRRAYVNAGRTKSWIYNIGTTAWEVSSNDVIANVGNSIIVSPHTGYVFTGVTWSGSEGSATASVTADGSLITGDTITIGNAIYSDKSDQNLHLRTIINDTPEFLNIETDDNFIRFSGVSSVINGQNFGTGHNVFTGKTDTTMGFRTLKQSGDTTISLASDGSLIIYSSSNGSTDTITGATNVGSGTTIYSGTTDRNLQFNSLIGSGTTSISKVGDDVIIYSSGGTGNDNCYDLSSPSVIPVGGICTGTVLTGKTSFQLWEELLVPELCGTITAPSTTSVGLSVSGLREIDESISQTVTINFSRGCINPQYCSVSDKRSGIPDSYCFSGAGMPSGFINCSSLSASYTNAAYDVLIGTQTWGGCTCYNAGLPALSSKGTEYCSALAAGITCAKSNTIVGVYPIYGTTSSISVLTKQTLQNMSTANNIQLSLVADSSPNKQKFEIPCAWLGAPTNRSLVGVCQWNAVSSQWEYPGGSAGTSLSLWTASSTTETVQVNSVGYCQYTYNSIDRSGVCIRLVF